MQSEAAERAEPREGRVSPGAFSAADLPTLDCQVVALNLPRGRGDKEGRLPRLRKQFLFCLSEREFQKKRLIPFLE